METSIAPTYVGLDAHKDSISAAILAPSMTEPVQERIANSAEAVRGLVQRLGDPAALRVAYEAGPTGYELARVLRALDVDCQVIAPALTPQAPGERVKTDRRDARRLATLLRAGLLVPVRVPAPDEEAVRDLLRLREDLGEDVLRARHRLSKFLLRHGRVYRGNAWTRPHLSWIREQRFALPLLERLRDEHLAAVDLRLAQREALERSLLEIAGSEPYAAAVRRLSALRGVKALTALTLLVEVGDFRRFGSAAEFMGFTGLVPSEDSSGARTRRGAITKTGNAHLRRVLVEAAWAYRARPVHASERRSHSRWSNADPAARAFAVTVEQRLHQRFWRMVQRGKRSQIVAVAIARELAGAVWALMRLEAEAA